MQLEHVLGTVSVCTMKEASNANKKQHGNGMKQMCYVGKDSRTELCVTCYAMTGLSNTAKHRKKKQSLKLKPITENASKGTQGSAFSNLNECCVVLTT